MTEKDFEFIARAFKCSKPTQPKDIETDSQMIFTLSINQWFMDVDMMANRLQDNFTRFDREKFLTACGYNE